MSNTDERRTAEPGRGRDAASPVSVPASGWKDILWRTYQEINDDRVTMIAAAVTYFLLLALFPALTAFVSVYGLFADPATVSEHMTMLSTVLPAGGLDIIQGQLTRLTSEPAATLGWTLAVSLGLALWSAGSGVKSLFEAMNIAYDEREKRNFFKLNLTALLFTLAGVIGALVMVAIVVVLPLVLSIVGLGEGFEWLVQIAGYAIMVAVLVAGIAALYRFGPSRQKAKWRWITPGAVLAVVLMLVISLLFTWYASNVAKFDATYGSLGALIGFLSWMWLSLTAIIVGAELNSEAEHQTARDSTVGEDQPMGQRNASMADSVGKSTKEAEPEEARSDEESSEWRAGYEAASNRYRRPRRPMSGGAMAFALPASLALLALGRRRANKPPAS